MIGSVYVVIGILATAIQWGWQPLADGGREYIVQVEPQLADLDSFRKDGFESDVPPTLRDIRRIRIVVGSEPLPNQGEIPAAPAPLPAGVSAVPLNPLPFGPTAPAESPSAKVALADHHQPTEPAAGSSNIGNSEPTENAATAERHSQTHSPSEQPSDNSPLDSSAGPRPWLTLLFVAGGLIVSLSGNIFLGWVHWGTRNQYRALVERIRGEGRGAKGA